MGIRWQAVEAGEQSADGTRAKRSEHRLSDDLTYLDPALRPHCCQ